MLALFSCKMCYLGFLAILFFCCGVFSEVTKEPIIFGNSTKDIVVLEGQNFTLRCYADGNPPPMVSWGLYGNEPNAIPVAKSSKYENFLTISNATPYNCGTYSCIAENGVGKDHREMLFLVNSPPRSFMQREIWTQALSFGIDLECSYHAYPLPESYYWSKNGIQLSNNSQYEIQNFSSGQNLFHTKLRIKNIEKHHFGNYVCHVKNQFGTAESSVTLTEVKDPVCPPACSPATTLPPNASAASIKLSIFYCIMFLPLTHVWLNFNSN